MEKFLRQLAATPLTIYQVHKSDFEAMKKLAKDILKSWADQRRLQILLSEEKPKAVAPKQNSQKLTKLSNLREGRI